MNSSARAPLTVSEPEAAEMCERLVETARAAESPRKKKKKLQQKTTAQNEAAPQHDPIHTDTQLARPDAQETSSPKTPERDTTAEHATRPSRVTRSHTRRSADLHDAESNATILRYPQGGPHSVTLLGADLHRLDYDQFLNDTVIEFGLRYLLEQVRARDAELSASMHMYSTFFYMKMSEFRDRTRSYEQVRKWTNRVDMCVAADSFSKRYLIVPINEYMHWYLAVVVNPAGVLHRDTHRRQSQRLASTPEPKNDTPPPTSPARRTPTKIVPGESRRTPAPEEPAYVFVFDSVRTSHASVKTVLRDYLRLEARDKGHVAPDIDVRNLGDMVHIDVRVPEQPNSSDCGIYLLHFFERFFSNPTYFVDVALESRRGTATSTRVHSAWEGDHIEARRGEWRKLVLDLSEAWQAHPHAPADDDSEIEMET